MFDHGQVVGGKIVGCLDEFDEADDRRDRRTFQHVDEIISGGRDDDPHGLGQDNSTEHLARWHADRLGRFGLSLVDTVQSGPNDLGHVGALVEPKTQERCGESSHQHVGGFVDEVEIGERQSELDHRKDESQVVPEDDLQQNRQSPEQPRVDRRHVARDRISRNPHQSDDDADDDGAGLRHHGQHNGVGEALEHHFLYDHAGYERIIDLALGQGDHQQHDDESDDDGGQVSAPVGDANLGQRPLRTSGNDPCPVVLVSHR